MKAYRLELYSSLSLDECQRRLQEVLYIWRLNPLGTALQNWNSVVRGGITGRDFWLRKRRYFWSIGQPWFTGSLQSHGDGTRIVGQVETSAFTLWFLILWCGGAVIAPFVDSPKYAVPANESYVLLIAGVAAAGLNWAASRGEPQFLVDYLRQTLLAEGRNADLKTTNGHE